MQTGLKQLASSSATASAEAFKKPIQDFYRTDPISRASVTMAACSKAFTKKDYETRIVDDAISGQVSIPSDSNIRKVKV